MNINISQIRMKLIKNSLQDTVPLLNKKESTNNIDETFIEKILNMELGMSKNIKAKEVNIISEKIKKKK